MNIDKLVMFYSREKHTHLKEELRQFRIHLSELDELAPLKQWEVSEISLQAAQKIMLSQPEEALTQLADISQNFPIRARYTQCLI